MWRAIPAVISLLSFFCHCDFSDASRVSAEPEVTRAGLVLTESGDWLLQYYGSTVELDNAKNDSWATATFVPAGHEGTQGWNKFYVEGNKAKPGEEGSYAAGYLEGALSHESIYAMHLNNFDDWFGKKTKGASVGSVFSWLESNYAWMKQNVDANKQDSEDEYWLAVGRVLKQLEVRGFYILCSTRIYIRPTTLILIFPAVADYFQGFARWV